VPPEVAVRVRLAAEALRPAVALALVRGAAHRRVLGVSAHDGPAPGSPPSAAVSARPVSVP
jgi:hypothetical protein